jgi:acyl dehydratase
MPIYLDQPRCFDDVQLGDIWRSPARTITEADVVNFAGLTGDYNPLHVDHAFARTTPFGRPIAHGLLGLSIVAGLGSNSPAMCTAAFVRVIEWKFIHPIYIGDTMHVETEVVEKNSRGKRHGLITWQRRLINQENGMIIQQGAFETLVKTKEQSAAA